MLKWWLENIACCVQMFADQGLRTLCCAVKEVSPDVFLDWKQRHHAARSVVSKLLRCFSFKLQCSLSRG